MSCDIVLLSSIISLRHCQIEFRNSQMYIRNIEVVVCHIRPEQFLTSQFQQSLNGTFVNNSKIAEETELKEGDMIGIGE